jgi:hypothetical protein
MSKKIKFKLINTDSYIFILNNKTVIGLYIDNLII